MSKRAVERYLMLFDTLTAHPEGLTRRQLHQLIPDYAATASESSFIRKFERDKAALRGAGLLQETGNQNIGEEFKYRAVTVDSTRFARQPQSVGGIGALAFAAQAWGSGKVSETLNRALNKLGWIAPDRIAYSGSDLASAPLTEAQGLNMVAAAVAENRLIVFDYQNNTSGDWSHRTVQVLGLGQRFDRWYALGQEISGQVSTKPVQIKRFRLDRIANLRLDRQCSRQQQPVDIYGELESLTDICAHTVYLRDPVHSTTEILPSYSAEDTVSQALAACKVVLEDTSLRESSYQTRVRLLYLAQLEKLVDIHTGDPVFPSLQWVSNDPQRRRYSAEESTLNLLAIAHFAQLHQGIHIKALAQQFGMGATAMRRNLNLLFVSLGESNFNFQETEDGLVYVRTGLHLQQATQLTQHETFLLLLTISALREKTTDSAALNEAEMLLSVVAPTTKSLKQRLLIFREESSTATLFREAIEDQQTLKITYSSRESQTERIIYPLEIFSDFGIEYLRAWCHSREGIRHFRLDRIRILGEVDDIAVPETVDHGQLPTNWVKGAKGSAVIRVREPEKKGEYQQLLMLALEQASTPDAVYYRLPLASSDWLLKTIARCGGGAELIHPRCLSEQLRSQYQQLSQVS